MPINLQNEQNIATGWPGPPQLHAPEIGSLVHAILGNRLGQQKLTQESIADAIKNIQQQRESAAYTDALQKAGLLPEGDYGGLGIKGGGSLAALLQRKQALDALAAHRSAMETRIGGRGRGGDDGGGSDQAYPETTWDDQGREWRKGPGGRLIPMKPAGGTKAGQTDDISKAVKEELGLQETIVEHKKRIAKEEAANIAALKPNVPYSQSDEYNTTQNRLKQLQAIPGMPSTAPAETGPVGSDKAGGHAQDYGVPPVGTIRGGYRFKGGDPKDQNSWEPI